MEKQEQEVDSIMKPIELYDIVALDNNEKYTVIKIINDSEKKYYLLAWIDEEENPNLENIKIAEETIDENGEKIVAIVENDEKLKKLAKEFLNTLNEDF